MGKKAGFFGLRINADITGKCEHSSDQFEA